MSTLICNLVVSKAAECQRTRDGSWFNLFTFCKIYLISLLHYSDIVIARWFIVGGEPERARLAQCFLMAHKPWIIEEFLSLCCSMSMVSKTLCSHFSSQWSHYGYTHAWTITSQWSLELNLWRLWASLCMALTWSELNYCAWFDGPICEQPALDCHGLQLACVR